MELQRRDEIQMTIISGSVVTSVGGLASFYDSDWYVNVMLTKNFDLTDYVQINKDSFQYTIDRQKINPYFYELGFLETIDSISYNKENIQFWSDIVNQNQNLESPVLYNTLFNIMKGSFELKSTVFDIQILPDPVSSQPVNVIVEKMNEIKTLTESNQIDFVNSNLPK